MIKIDFFIISNRKTIDKRFDLGYIISTSASYPSGKEAVCKTVMQQFDSARRLFKKESQTRLFFVFRVCLGKAGTRFYIFAGFSKVKPAFFLISFPLSVAAQRKESPAPPDF